ncbi:MAG: acetamidase/formamidase family protein, partial [Bacilli bacterium]
TAVECPASATIRVTLHKQANIKAPQIDAVNMERFHESSCKIFLGIGPDLMKASQEAALQAVEALARSLKVDEASAYNLLGIVGDLRIHEIVDQPNWVVGCLIPARLF